MDLMVLMGIVFVVMETIMGSTGMDYIGGIFNPILWEKCPKYITKINIVMVLLEKLIVHNGILMWWAFGLLLYF